MRFDLSGMSVAELLGLYAQVVEELRRAGATRTANNPVADYTERLVCAALGLRQSPNSEAGCDAKDLMEHRYQIKGRRVTAQNRSLQLSAIRGLDEHPFDFLVGVLFRADFTVELALQVPIAVVASHSRFRRHTNSHCFHLRRSLLAQPGVVDLTEVIASVALERVGSNEHPSAG